MMVRRVPSVIVGLAVVGVSSMASFTLVAKDVELKTDIQKASYGIGQRIGRSMKAQGVEVDVDVLGASIKDALEDKPSRLKDEEIEAAMTKLQEGMQKKMEEMAKKNKEEGEKYLANHKKESGVKTTASGLQYKVLKEGSGASPTDKSTVKVHYVGKTIDGKEFDSSVARNTPAEFPVGGVIPGWTEALKMMKPGAKWQLTIPSDLAYGSRGQPGIPPNSVLNFEVELLEVKNPEEHKAADKAAAKVGEKPAAKDSKDAKGAEATAKK